MAQLNSINRMETPAVGLLCFFREGTSHIPLGSFLAFFISSEAHSEVWLSGEQLEEEGGIYLYPFLFLPSLQNLPIRFIFHSNIIISCGYPHKQRVTV